MAISIILPLFAERRVSLLMWQEMYRRNTYFPADEERRIKLIIFDMDGVLFDSEPYYARAEKMRQVNRMRIFGNL